MHDREHIAAAPTGTTLPAGVPDAAAIMAFASRENFPVALRVLPRVVRADLMAVYGFARLADQLGDEYDGDRLAALDWLERDLEATRDDRAQHPVVVRLQPTIARHQLDLGPFRDLIEANRRDQHQHRYATFEELLDYCRLSANPVGRLVLGVFEVADERAIALSDDVCSGLQVIEHIQDVREDRAAGRIYLPLDDLARLGCTESQLDESVVGEPLRRLLAFECDRAAALLAAGKELVTILPCQPRVAVAGFVAGGLATLDAIEAARFDVLGQPVGPARRRVLFHAGRLLGARRTRATGTTAG
jgi:squalene synthase HpnC